MGADGQHHHVRCAVDILGSLAVTVDGARTEERLLGGRQGRLVFVALVLHRQSALPREQLAEMVWPGGLPPSWEPSLRTLVSKVRALFAAAGLTDSSVVSSAFGCYQLRLPAGTVVDAEHAVAMLGRARQALEAGDIADTTVTADAVRILRRPLLPGCGGEWVEHQRTVLRGQLARAWELHGEVLLRQRSPVDASAAAEESLVVEPYRESTYRLLMTAHVAAGNRAEALRAYERCRRLLADELGVDPAPETQQVYLQLLADPPAVTPDHAAAAPAAPVRLPPALDVVRAWPFVGRAEERVVITEAWRTAVAGRAGLVTVSGEPGIGKTRFAAEAALAVQRSQDVPDAGAWVLYGRCDEGIQVPDGPFAEALSGCLAAVPDAELRSLLGPLPGELVHLVPALAGRLPDIAPAPDLSLQAGRHRLLDAVAGCLTALAAARPVLLVLDDLQWATPPTLHLLRHVLRVAAVAPLLVVGIYRGAERTPALADMLSRIRRDHPLTELELSPLQPSEVDEMLAVTRLDGTRAERVREQAEGNPLFVTYLAEHLRDGDAREAIPHSVRELVTGRIGSLPETVGSILAAAAVAGRSCDIRLLEAITGKDEDTVLDAVDHAMAAGLVEPVPGVPDQVRFSHALVHAAIRESVSPPRLLRWHRRIGEALEADPDAGARLPELAHHFAAAAPVGDTAKAIRYARLAGDEARARLGFSEAADHYRQALRLHPDLSTRCDLQIAAGEALNRAADPEYRGLLLAAAEDARHLGDPRRLARAALAFNKLSYAAPRDTELIDLLEEAIAELPPEEAVLRARAQGMLAVALMYRDEDAQRRVALVDDAATTLHRAADPATLAGHLITTHAAVCGPDRLAERFEAADLLTAIGTEIGLREATAHGHNLRLDALVESGELGAALAEFRTARRAATETHEPRLVAEVAVRNVGLLIVTGRFREAEAATESLIAEGRRTGFDPDMVRWTQAMATLAIADHQDRLGESFKRIERMRRRIVSVGGWPFVAAYLRARTGKLDEAAEYLAACDAALTPPVPGNPTWLSRIALMAGAAVALRDTRRAATMYELLLPYAGRWAWAFAACAGPVDLQLARLAPFADAGAALDHFAAAAAACEANDTPAWLARTRVEWAEALAEAGEDAGKVAELARAALTAAGQYGLAGIGRHARDLLAEL